MPNNKYVLIGLGILLGMFVIPFATARLGGKGGAISRNRAA